jgi:hypothetical protein
VCWCLRPGRLQRGCGHLRRRVYGGPLRTGYRPARSRSGWALSGRTCG